MSCCCGGALGRRVASQAGRPSRGGFILFIIKLSHEYAKPSAFAMPISCYRSMAAMTDSARLFSAGSTALLPPQPVCPSLDQTCSRVCPMSDSFVDPFFRLQVSTSQPELGTNRIVRFVTKQAPAPQALKFGRGAREGEEGRVLH